MTIKPLVLVDGSSYLYRAFHALPPLTTASGQPTGAIFGVTSMLLKLLDDYAPEELAVVFDAPGKTFRDDLFAEYKANRAPMPDDLRAQIGPLLEVIEALGIPVLKVDGVEADDVIGTLAARAAATGRKTVISTIDKDMAQLVDECVVLVNTMDGTTLDMAGVRTKFGVVPARITDYLALVGDTSDNIPGVPKVGPKTAAKWLAEYGDLAMLKARAAEIPGKAGESLRAHLGQLDLNKELATIRCDLMLPPEAAALARRAPQSERLRELFGRLEFGRLLRRFEEQIAAPEQSEPGESPAVTAPEPTYATLRTLDELDAWIARVQSAPVAALDAQTAGVDYMRAELIGIAIAVGARDAAYVPVGHRYPGAPDQLPHALVLERLREWLESDRPKAGHRLKHTAHVLAGCGIRLGGMSYDAMLESYVLNSTGTRHDLAGCAAKYLGVTAIKYEDVAGKGAKQIDFDQVDVDAAARYAAQDADMALRLHETLWPRLREVPDLERVYMDIERPLIGVLQKMESVGVRVDAEMLRRQSQELAETMARTETAAHAAAGGPFLLGSPKQLQEVLYERLRLPVLGKTPTGQPSTAEDVLQELAATYELPRLVL